MLISSVLRTGKVKMWRSYKPGAQGQAPTRVLHAIGVIGEGAEGVHGVGAGAGLIDEAGFHGLSVSRNETVL